MTITTKYNIGDEVIAWVFNSLVWKYEASKEKIARLVIGNYPDGTIIETYYDSSNTELHICETMEEAIKCAGEMNDVIDRQPNDFKYKEMDNK